MMDYVFEAIDKNGKKIRLPRKQWTHITVKHPYMTSYLDDIKETITNPDKISDYSFDEDVKYYYRYLKHKESPNKYLLVAVKYLNGGSFVITAYFVNRIK